MSKVEFLDFDVIQESWDKYLLPNKSILRLHSLLIMPLKKTHANGDIEYNLRTSVNYSISKDGVLLGINSGGAYPINQIREFLIESPIEPITVLELSDNKYKLNDGKTFITKTEIEEVQKTSLFNDGISIYYVKTKKTDMVE